MPGAPSSVLVPTVRHLLLVAMPEPLVAFLFLLVRHLLLVAMPGAPSSVLVPTSKALAPSSDARSP